jgi:hypothetical protein
MKKYIVLIILAIAVSCFAANEIQFTGTVNSEYCIRIMDANNAYDFDNDNWNISSSTDPNGFLDATESSLTPGYYLADMPSVSPGTYTILIYDSNAATVNAATDFDGGFKYDWNGSQEISFWEILNKSLNDIYNSGSMYE